MPEVLLRLVLDVPLYGNNASNPVWVEETIIEAIERAGFDVRPGVPGEMIIKVQ